MLIAFAGGIYLCFQIFSMKVLNFSHQKDLKSRVLHAGKVMQDPPEIDNYVPSDDSKDRETNNEHDTDVQSENKFNVKDTQNTINTEPKVLGILNSLYEKYTPQNGKFQCLNSKELIPFSSVNDDYCDCEDSTDEPGTSACPDSKFYCTFQNQDLGVQYIPGSRVNDGVCDCCDGSDEWSGITVFSGVKLTEKRLKGTLTHAPCSNTCQEAKDVGREDAKIRELGKKIRLEYVQKGRASNNANLYGQDGAFFKLSLECFEFSSPEYKYKLCPFKSATQQKFPAPATNIGSSPVWKMRLPGHYELKMDKGDPSNCPFGVFRHTVILFICGLTDKILEVSEKERCSYSMRFATPAAC